MNTLVQNPARFYCSICKRRTKGFKSQAGLQSHETLKHIAYNTPPQHIRSVPKSELLHLKRVIVKELQKRLKNHHTAVGEQTFSIHCSEDAFVGLFKNILRIILLVDHLIFVVLKVKEHLMK
ncbi:unnamed protein product [Rhizophagus irregularis]|nr:unnamed protein product [Rhizophagus irregularis]